VDATRWLLARGVLGRRGALGTDAFSPDVGMDAGYTVSRLLYREHRISLEVLAGLAQLPARGFHILVGGAIHRKGAGAPAAVYAILDEPD
jgi:kynurenine formamidase